MHEHDCGRGWVLAIRQWLSSPCRQGHFSFSGIVGGGLLTHLARDRIELVYLARARRAICNNLIRYGGKSTFTSKVRR